MVRVILSTTGCDPATFAVFDLSSGEVYLCVWRRSTSYFFLSVMSPDFRSPKLPYCLNSTYIPHTRQETESNTKNRHGLLASITSTGTLCIHIPLIIDTFCFSHWQCARQLTYTHVVSSFLISFRWLLTIFVFHFDCVCGRNPYLEAVYNGRSDDALLAVHGWNLVTPELGLTSPRKGRTQAVIELFLWALYLWIRVNFPDTHNGHPMPRSSGPTYTRAGVPSSWRFHTSSSSSSLSTWQYLYDYRATSEFFDYEAKRKRNNRFRRAGE